MRDWPGSWQYTTVIKFTLTVVADFVLVDVLAAVGLGSGRALSGLGEGNEGEDREDDAGEAHFDGSLEVDSGTVTAEQPVFYIQQTLSTDSGDVPFAKHD
ncbi:hypothetical protein TESG_04895 [Trichophyton tonsurans CBS 112818]|uniref:Uncharacterized protein n=1 Tax=Trichophyton tonsurans (strain CBS 112818) TaxID=647933 RepID=F2S1N8_TRIT1|nr:hypothetical protein TESG_04895 [Trichophyton tonsurans CBS 112818]